MKELENFMIRRENSGGSIVNAALILGRHLINSRKYGTYNCVRLSSLANVASVILVIALFCSNLQARQTVFED